MILLKINSARTLSLGSRSSQTSILALRIRFFRFVFLFLLEIDFGNRLESKRIHNPVNETTPFSLFCRYIKIKREQEGGRRTEVLFKSFQNKEKKSFHHMAGARLISFDEAAGMLLHVRVTCCVHRPPSLLANFTQ